MGMDEDALLQYCNLQAIYTLQETDPLQSALSLGRKARIPRRRSGDEWLVSEGHSTPG